MQNGIIETAKTGKKYCVSARFAKGGAFTHYSGLYNETKTLEYKSLRPDDGLGYRNKTGNKRSRTILAVKENYEQ